MKTPNLGIFLLAALFCGALFCTYAEAKVCFVGDPNCAGGADFGKIDPLPTDDLCKQEGYTTVASACNNPGGVCPYDARYVKCCSSEYAYQGCVFPLETVKKTDPKSGKLVSDKCGSLYKCQCNSEYKTPAQWNTGVKNCQPGGGVCLLSTNDTVYYNKCVCDVNYFPYEGSCPADMKQIEKCTDSDGKSRVSCQCPSNYRTCTYGGAAGAKSCQQGGLILYSSCKSPEDECKNAGYFKDCDKQTCYFDTNSTERVKGQYPISCEDSTEACPYAYGFYKCRWSAANYCAKWDMTEYSKKLPSTCSKDGVQGTVIPCNLGGSYNGGGSTKNYLGYYRCKLTCEQQVRGAYSQGYLSKDDSLVDSNGQQVFYRTDSNGRNHLYLINKTELVVPLKVEKGAHGWDTIGNKKNYASVNGIAALYDVDSKRYSSCGEDEERSYGTRPKLKLDHMRVQGESWLLNTDLSDINVQFYYSSRDDKNSYGESYQVDSHTWKNVTFSESTIMPSACQAWAGSGIHYLQRGDCKGPSPTRIFFRDWSHTTITGNVDLDIYRWIFSNNSWAFDDWNNSQTNTPAVQFVLKNRSVVKFKDASIDGFNSSWSGEDWGTLIFDNAQGSIGNLWHRMNVIFTNRSNMRVDNMRIEGWKNNDSTTSIGGYNDCTTGSNDDQTRCRSYRANCHGIGVFGYSTVNVDGAVRIARDYSKIYIDYGSAFNTKKHVIMNSKWNQEVCIAGKFTGKAGNNSFSASGYSFYYGRNNNACVPYWTGDYSVNKGYARGCAQDYYMNNGVWNSGCQKKSNYGYQCSIDNVWQSSCSFCGSYGFGYNE